MYYIAKTWRVSCADSKNSFLEIWPQKKIHRQMRIILVSFFFASFLFFCFLPISAQISTDERKYTVIRFALSKISKYFLQKISDIAILIRPKPEISSK